MGQILSLETQNFLGNSRDEQIAATATSCDNSSNIFISDKDDKASPFQNLAHLLLQLLHFLAPAKFFHPVVHAERKTRWIKTGQELLRDGFVVAALSAPGAVDVPDFRGSGKKWRP